MLDGELVRLRGVTPEDRATIERIEANPATLALVEERIAFPPTSTRYDELFGRIGEAEDRSTSVIDLNEVKLSVFATNERAIRSYEKAGFVVDGRLRQEVYRGGRYIDTLEMSILRADRRG